MFIVVGRLTLTAYGPFGTAKQAKKFIKARQSGLSSKTKYYAVVQVIPGDFVTAAIERAEAASQFTLEEGFGFEPTFAGAL